MKPSILIDATHFGTAEPTGVENYVDNLLPLLSKELLAKGWTVTWVGHTEKPADLPEGVEWIQSKHRKFWSQTGLLALLNKHKPSLFFTPSGLSPLGYMGKTAVTIHDMASFLDPGAFTTGQKFRLKFMTVRNVKQASIILTPSLYTKNQIKKLWAIADEKIRVVPLGFQKSEVKSQGLAIATDLPVITYVGRIERKKNLLPILEAFARLNGEARLVLAGKDGLGVEEIRERIKGLPWPVLSHIVLPGYISEAQKNWLYENSSVIICPCPTEGFGLPVLEAFAARVPVVAAACGALPEVGDGAALYARPDEAEDWQNQLEKVLNDKDLAKELVGKGLERVKDFSWKHAAELTAKALVL